MKNIENNLLKLTLKYGINLWLFNELFVKQDYPYSFYLENYKNISNYTLRKETWKKVRKLLTEYIKND